ncbi:unnamed protein product, partial [Adineta ricciae]
TPFLDSRLFDLRWVMHPKLPTELKLQLCKTINRLVASVALQLHGAGLQEHNDTIVETLPIATANNKSPGVKRKTLFAFPKDNEPLVKRTRSNTSGQTEEEILLLSKETSDDCSLIFAKATIYPYLNFTCSSSFVCTDDNSTSGTDIFYKWIRDATTQRTHV